MQLDQVVFHVKLFWLYLLLYGWDQRVDHSLSAGDHYIYMLASICVIRQFVNWLKILANL